MDDLDWRAVEAVILHGGAEGKRLLAAELVRRANDEDIAVLWATVRSGEPHVVRAGCLHLLWLIVEMGGSAAAEWIMRPVAVVDATGGQDTAGLTAQPGQATV